MRVGVGGFRRRWWWNGSEREDVSGVVHSEVDVDGWRRDGAVEDGEEVVCGGAGAEGSKRRVS